MKYCHYCFEQSCEVSADKRWGLICSTCHADMASIDRESNADTWSIEARLTGLVFSKTGTTHDGATHNTQSNASEQRSRT